MLIQKNNLTTVNVRCRTVDVQNLEGFSMEIKLKRGLTCCLVDHVEVLKLNEAETLRFGSDLIHHDGHTFDCSDFAKIFFEIIFCDDAFVEAGNKYFLDYITGNIAL